MKQILFIATDPLKNEVKLLKETFEKHIIIRHPEMKGHISSIKKVIENPLYIGQGTKNRESLIYLGNFQDNKKIPYLIVAVKYIKKLDQIILTAFGTQNLGLNKINKILWQQKKQNLITPTLPPHKN